ncbi:MAG: hypothetical protein ACXWXA_11680, partial [Candidatus Limnocylindrales bacterium]
SGWSPRTRGRLLPLVLAAIVGAGCVVSVAPSTSQGSGWQLITDGDAGSAASFSAVIATTGGFLAAGWGPFGNSPVVLDSSDGRTWTAAAIEARSGGPAVLVPWGEKVLGFAGDEEGRCAHPSAIETWVRDVNGVWAEAPFDPLFCAGAGNGSLLVHAGHPLLIGAGNGDVPYDLTSDDGLHWVDHPHAFGDNFYPQAVASDGAWVWLFGSADDGSPVVTRSADGVTWEPPSPLAVIGRDGAVQSAVVVDGRLKVFAISAAGTLGVLEPAVGGGWVSAPTDGIRGDQLARVQVVDHHLLATGADENGVPLAWVSADGTTWSPMRMPAEAGNEASLTGVAVANGVAILVGQVVIDGRGVGAIWIGSPDLLAR